MQEDRWTAKNLRILQALTDHGPEAASALQTAFHASADAHAALARMHDLLGYDPRLRAEIERFGLMTGRTQ